MPFTGVHGGAQAEGAVSGHGFGGQLVVHGVGGSVGGGTHMAPTGHGHGAPLAGQGGGGQVLTPLAAGPLDVHGGGQIVAVLPPEAIVGHGGGQIGVAPPVAEVQGGGQATGVVAPAPGAVALHGGGHTGGMLSTEALPALRTPQGQVDPVQGGGHVTCVAGGGAPLVIRHGGHTFVPPAGQAIAAELAPPLPLAAGLWEFAAGLAPGVSFGVVVTVVVGDPVVVAPVTVPFVWGLAGSAGCVVGTVTAPWAPTAETRTLAAECPVAATAMPATVRTATTTAVMRAPRSRMGQACVAMCYNDAKRDSTVAATR